MQITFTRALVGIGIVVTLGLGAGVVTTVNTVMASNTQSDYSIARDAFTEATASYVSTRASLEVEVDHANTLAATVTRTNATLDGFIAPAAAHTLTVYVGTLRRRVKMISPPVTVSKTTPANTTLDGYWAAIAKLQQGAQTLITATAKAAQALHEIHSRIKTGSAVLNETSETIPAAIVTILAANGSAPATQRDLFSKTGTAAAALITRASYSAEIKKLAQLSAYGTAGITLTTHTHATTPG